MEKFFKHPWIIVVLITAITVFFSLQLPNVQLDNNNFRFVPEDDPARVLATSIDEEFGSSISVMVGFERTYGTIFDPDFLLKLKEYSDRISRLPIVDTVSSIITTDYIGGSEEGITVEPLVSDSFSGMQEEIALLKERLLAWEMYRKAIVSDNFKATQVLVTLDISSENAGSPESVQAYLKVKGIAYETGFENTRIYVTGIPVFSAEINKATNKDLRMLIPLVAIAVLLVLFLSFRRIGGIVLPMLTVAISAIWAIGAMALLGVQLSIISTILPVILVAVGSAYGIHIVSHYYDKSAGKRELSDREHRQIVYSTLRIVGRPVFLAALTTFAGFSSLCFTSVVPIFEFGIFASAGVIVALIVALSFVPALIIIKGPPAKGNSKKRLFAGSSETDRLSDTIADTFGALARKRKLIIFLSLVIVAFSVVGISKMVIDNVLVEYFKSDTDIVKSDEYIRKYFGGSKTLSIVVRGKDGGDVLRPDILSAMDGLSRYLGEEVPEVGKAVGFTDLVKRINQVFNADESPDGLTKAAVEENAAHTGFGFGDSYETSYAFDEPEKAEKKAVEEELLTKPQMVRILSEGLAAGAWNMSADELVRQLERSINYQGRAYYEIPADPERYGKTDAEELKALVSNYLVLLSSDIDSFANDPLEPTAIRMNLQLRTVGHTDTKRAVAAIENYIEEFFPKDIQVEVGGIALVEGSLNKHVVRSQIISVIASLALVFLILSLYYRSAIAGLVGLTPLGLSILINFAVMGFFGIKLNIGTAMVASIAVGVGIDYSIHYMASYHHEWLSGLRGMELLRNTYKSSGKAILFNASSVGVGFAVLTLSQFNLLIYLGALITLTMATSALVSLTVLPVLLELIRPAFIQRALPFEKNQKIPEENR